MLQRVKQAAGQLGKHGKIVERLWQDLKIPPRPRMPTRAVVSEFMALQKDILNLAGIEARVGPTPLQPAGRRSQPGVDPCTWGGGGLTQVPWKESEGGNLVDPSSTLSKVGWVGWAGWEGWEGWEGELRGMCVGGRIVEPMTGRSWCLRDR